MASFILGAMMAELPEASSGKGRRRSAAKAANRPGGSKVKATIHLTVEASHGSIFTQR